MLAEPENRSLARDEWSRGWPLILASTAGMSIGPLMTYTMGMFVAPLQAEFGWNRATIVSALTINSAMGVLLAPFFGALIDRFGPRKLALPGVIVFCGAFALLSTVSNSPLHWWGLWVIVSLGVLLVMPTVWTYAVVSRFRQARGLALAVALSGTAMTGVIGPLLANYFIQTVGWRSAYIGIGAIYCLFALPLVVFFFFSASEQAQRGRSNERATDEQVAAPLPGLTVSQAVRSGAFWKIALATFLVLFPISGLVVHLVPALTEAGLYRSGAVFAASCMGMAAIAGRLLAGTLLDRTNAKLVAGIAFGMPAASCLALVNYHGSLEFGIGIAALLGLCTGAELEMSSYLSSRHFGMRSFGTLFGFVGGLIGLASGLAPVIGGLVFDAYGSYKFALFGGATLALVASALIFSLPPYPKKF